MCVNTPIRLVTKTLRGCFQIATKGHWYEYQKFKRGGGSLEIGSPLGLDANITASMDDSPCRLVRASCRDDLLKLHIAVRSACASAACVLWRCLRHPRRAWDEDEDNDVRGQQVTVLGGSMIWRSPLWSPVERVWNSLHDFVESEMFHYRLNVSRLSVQQRQTI